MTMLSGFSPVGLLLSVVLLAGCGQGSHSPPPRTADSELLGKPVPPITRTALDGTKVSTAELKGRVVVFEFFAEYCVPCRAALPAAVSAQRERPEATFIGISEDDGPDTAQQMANQYAVPFKVVHDQDRVIAARLRVQDLPVTIVLDGTGVVRWVGTTAISKDDLVRVIDDVSRPAGQ